jgi:two-component system response regulator PilR (NtrC family)
MHSQAHILVVDDWPKWRARIEKVLKARGYAVETAASYEEAKRLLDRELFDVAVVDTRLIDADESNIDGLRLLKEIESLRKGTSLVVLTGYVTRELVASVLVDFYFVEKKHFDSDNFLKIVERAVDRAKGRQPGATMHG